MWVNKSDSLILKFKSNFKKPLEGCENCFYDTSIMTIKYIENGKIIFNNLNVKADENCFLVKTTINNTNMFHLDNFCKSHTDSYLIFMRGVKSLCLLSPFVERNRRLLKTEDGAEIVIPNSIILDRVVN